MVRMSRKRLREAYVSTSAASKESREVTDYSVPLEMMHCRLRSVRLSSCAPGSAIRSRGFRHKLRKADPNLSWSPLPPVRQRGRGWPLRPRRP